MINMSRRYPGAVTTMLSGDPLCSVQRSTIPVSESVHAQRAVTKEMGATHDRKRLTKAKMDRLVHSWVRRFPYMPKHGLSDMT